MTNLVFVRQLLVSPATVEKELATNTMTAESRMEQKQRPVGTLTAFSDWHFVMELGVALCGKDGGVGGRELCGGSVRLRFVGWTSSRQEGNRTVARMRYNSDGASLRIRGAEAGLYSSHGERRRRSEGHRHSYKSSACDPQSDARSPRQHGYYSVR